VRSKDDFTIVGPLPKKNIDTGMGLERMASLLQGRRQPLRDRRGQAGSGQGRADDRKTYGAHSGPGAAQAHPDDVRLRVVADHVRSSLMLIGDGVTPGNEGRGYVLRRMLRRAVRSMRLLGYADPCLPELLPVSLATG
jgi:alanyl-tRNA synthetase